MNYFKEEVNQILKALIDRGIFKKDADFAELLKVNEILTDGFNKELDKFISETKLRILDLATFIESNKEEYYSQWYAKNIEQFGKNIGMNVDAIKYLKESLIEISSDELVRLMLEEQPKDSI